uniref:BAG family molecular chaperone regulator 1 n=2 Tax=Meloidogyne incognita group TaxID=654580 RepID=A0A914MY73_MELIC
MFLIFKHNKTEFKIQIKVGNNNDGNETEGGESSESLPSTLGELRKQISQKTQCDITTMKLIKKGKFIIAPMEESLENLGFNENDKILVIGGSSKIDEGKEILIKYEKTHLTKLNGIFKEIDEDLSEMERNFLEGEMLNEMLRRMEKRLNEFTEHSLQHLEAIDALNIYTDNSIEEQNQRNRERRKTLVDSIQELLRANDKNILRFEQYKKSLEFPDLKS